MCHTTVRAIFRTLPMILSGMQKVISGNPNQYLVNLDDGTFSKIQSHTLKVNKKCPNMGPYFEEISACH